jgi:hypothetical protein
MNSHEILETLKPKPCPVKLVRIGGEHDGAYLIPDDLNGIDACLSPGVNNFKYFEDELTTTYGVKCHMCDYSSDLDSFATPLINGMQTFEKKWLDIDSGVNSISLEDWVQKYSPNLHDDLILQMDIEGAEYRNILAASITLLTRFRIIVIELHGLDAFSDPELLGKEIGPLVQKLDATHICVHAHPNNCCGEMLDEDSGMNIPKVIELTYLRRDRFTGDSRMYYQPQLPNPLDIACNTNHLPCIHLNEKWLRGRPRSKDSMIKILQDDLGRANFELTQLMGQSSAERTNLCKTYTQAIANLCEASIVHRDPQMAELPLSLTHEKDLANGKPFTLSSSYNSHASTGTVSSSESYFFHTALGRNQSITVDLCASHRLNFLVLRNRQDNCQGRAEGLFWMVHDKPEYCLENIFPVLINEDFLSPEGADSVTPLMGATGRYITIYTPLYTALHFSSLQVYS